MLRRYAASLTDATILYAAAAAYDAADADADDTL